MSDAFRRVAGKWLRFSESTFSINTNLGTIESVNILATWLVVAPRKGKACAQLVR